ncbi:multiheme c-type cytochrome, partial [Kaarinaea lacus]
MLRRCLGIIIVLSGLQVAAAGQANWRLVYSSDFRAELKPCGCTAEGDLGGILRRATRFEQLRKDKIPTLFVSAGDILGEQDEQGMIKNRYMLKAQSGLGLDAILPGERELVLPAETLTRHSLPWVLSNAKQVLPFASYIEKHPGKQRVLIFGLLDPQLLDGEKKKRLHDMSSALQKQFESLRVTDKDIVIVLLHAGQNRVTSITEHPLVDIVVRGHLHETQKQYRIQHNNTCVLATGYRGQRIGIAEFGGDSGTKLLSSRVESLSASIADHPIMSQLYHEYDQEIKNWYQKKVVARQAEGLTTRKIYAGVKTCARCHEQNVTRWKATRHASALQSLIRTGKQNDPECLQCHNTGFGQAGGFVSEQLTAEYANVQCEA